LRNEMLVAAAALLDETGDPAAVTVRGVAARVGAAPNAVYLHFSNRDDLLIEAVTTRFATFTDTLRAIADTAAPIDRLRAGHHAYMAFARANPGVYRAMVGGQSLDPDNVELSRRLVDTAYPAFEELLGIVQRCIDVGSLPPTLDRDAFARLLFAAEHGWSDLSGSSRGALLPEQDHILDTLLALAAGAPGTA
jgi:AcrR family transcriptional regulator